MKTILLLLAVSLYAEDQKPCTADGHPCMKIEPQCEGGTCKPSKGMLTIPEVTMEHKLDYQRARANLAAVKEQSLANEKIAQKAIEDAIAQAAKDCGGGQVVADSKQDPSCAPEKK